MEQNCLNCKYAKWKRDTSNKLHRDGGGKCSWEMPIIIIPKAYYFVGYPNHQLPKPGGGFIDRRRPETNCPAWVQ